MQDGSFYGAEQTVNFGAAIFVFAGGVNATFQQFTKPPTSASTTSTSYFKDKKGPDFISRLRGHIDISSVNPPIRQSQEEYGQDRGVKPILRRAMILRSLIDRAGFLDKQDIARVDVDILFAMLTVNRFRHGARSMEAILRMCTPIRQSIEKASLPSAEQLGMHVDSRDFTTQVRRSRFWFANSAGVTSKTKNVDRDYEDGLNGGVVSRDASDYLL